MIVYASIFAFLFACVTAVIWLCHGSPVCDEYEDEEDRLQRIFLSAMHHRDHLDACYQEACELHDGTPEVRDHLAEVIYGGGSYTEAMWYHAMEKRRRG